MRTSTKILLSAFVILVIAIGIYNNALKAEYLTGNYKLPYWNYNKLNIKDFTEVEINGANMIDVQFKYGDHAIYTNKRNDDSVVLTKVGHRLVIDVNMHQIPEYTEKLNNGIETRYIDEDRRNKIIIICPKLSLLQTNDEFLVQGKKLGNYNYPTYFNSDRDPIQLQLFNTDSLTLVENGRSNIAISGNVIKYLKADVHRGSSLSIFGNMIYNANLDIKAGAELSLHNMAFKFAPGVNTQGMQTYTNLSCDISDSAKVKTDGYILKMLTNKKQ